MKKQYTPITVIANIKIKVDLNEVLEGAKPNVPMRDIKKAAGQFIRERLRNNVFVQGEKLLIPESSDIYLSLSECDMVSMDYEEDESC